MTIWQFNNPYHSTRFLPLKKCIIISLLLSWLLFAASETITKLQSNPIDFSESDKTVMAILLYPLSIGIIGRLFYYINGCNSPISLRMRLNSGKIIVPSFDQIFISPLCALLCYYLSSKMAKYAGPSIGLAIGNFGILLSLTSIGPDFNKWFYTGNYAIPNKEGSKLTKTQRKNLQQRQRKTMAQAVEPQDDPIDKIL